MIALLLAIATGALYLTGYGWVATMTGGLFLFMVVFYYPLRSISTRGARYEQGSYYPQSDTVSMRQFYANGESAGLSKRQVDSQWAEFLRSGACSGPCSGGSLEMTPAEYNAAVHTRFNAQLPDHLTLSGQSRQNAIENDPEGWTNPARFRELPDGMKTADHYPQPQRAGREQVHVHLDQRASARDVEQSENRPWIEPRFGRN